MTKGDTPREQVRPPDQPNLSREPGTPLDERRVAAWIGKSVVIKGNITCAQDLTIEGQVEGTIELSDHSLIIGAGASVTADLVGKSITISGRVSGNVTATDKVDLRATGTVTGNISAPRLVMAEGAFVMGRVDAGRAGPSAAPQAKS